VTLTFLFPVSDLFLFNKDTYKKNTAQYVPNTFMIKITGQKLCSVHC